MFCPKCGRKQTTNMRFCSGCGFQLDATSQLLASDGMMPMTPMMAQPPYPVEKKSKPKGMKAGVMLMLISAVISPIFFGGAIAADHPAPLIIPFTMFLAGLATLIYSYIFKDSTQPYIPQQPVRPYPINQPTALPSVEPYRVNNFNQPINTSEMVNPPSSVTESTTQLFDKEPQ